MNNYIVTISREFGCGARSIANKLASDLNIKLYDKELVDIAATSIGVAPAAIKEADEKVTRKDLFTRFGYGSSTAFYSDSAVNAQAEVIREIANNGENCIMFGRCADYFLREFPNVLKIFLYAPLEMRIRHISDNYDFERTDAVKLIRRVDKQRHNYYKYVTGQNRGDRYGKDLMIDVETFGERGAVNLMKAALQERGFL